MTSDDLSAYLSGRGIDVRRHGREWRTVCPAHDDPTPSLDFHDGDRAVILQCRAGCKTQAVAEAWGLSMADLFFDEPRQAARVIAEYEYRDERGGLLFVVERRDGKEFRQRRPDGNGGWVWNLNGTRRVPYRLPEIVQAIEAGLTVCIAEGEKDVHALEADGRIATCNPGGAGKWRDEYSELFRGARVVIIADRDEPGRRHAGAVAESLRKVARSVTLVEPVEGNDASDHLARHSFLDFVPMRLGDHNGRKLHDRIVDMGEAFVGAAKPLPERCGMLAIDGFVTVVAGMRAERKSWLSLKLCEGVANGSEIAGIKCRQGIALYVDAENGEREMARRFIGAGLGPDAFYVANGMGLHLPQDTHVIRELIKVTKANLCVLDSLRRLAPNVREDRSDDMAPVFAEISKLSRETDCAIIVLHHRSTKFGAPDTRGSSAIEDQTDLLYVLEGMRGDPERSFRKRLRCSKNRVDREPPARWLRFDQVAGFQTIAEAEPFEPEDDEAPSVPDQLIDEIRALAPEVRKDGAWAVHRVAKAVRRERDDRSFKAALGELLESGEWVAEGKTRTRVVRPSDGFGPSDPLWDDPNGPNDPPRTPF